MYNTHSMTTTIKQLLFEAYRRNDMSDPFERRKPMTRRWVGLGTEAAYRPAIKAGLMVFHDGIAPPPRCMGWLCLTEKGLVALREFESEFAQRLAFLKGNTAYHNSILSQYTLAGGISSR
jgi:hypothetical protein